MRLTLPGHRHRHLIDAFVDGELAPASAARFEAHMAGCPRCRASVEAASELKQTFASLTTVPVPRSFRLSAGMIAAPAPPLAATPIPLVLVRVAAAASVAAFAFAATLGLAPGRDGDRSTAFRDEAGTLESASAKDAPGMAEISGAAPLTDSSANDAELTPPGIASPLNGGDVAGAGMATSVVPVSTASPRTGGDVHSAGGAGPASASPAAAPEPAAPSSALSRSGSESTGDGGPPRVVVLGVIALAAVAILSILEFRRRGTS